MDPKEVDYSLRINGISSVLVKAKAPKVRVWIIRTISG